MDCKNCAHKIVENKDGEWEHKNTVFGVSSLEPSCGSKKISEKDFKKFQKDWKNKWGTNIYEKPRCGCDKPQPKKETITKVL